MYYGFTVMGGIVVAILLLGLATALFLRRRRSKRLEQEEQAQRDMEYQSGPHSDASYSMGGGGEGHMDDGHSQWSGEKSNLAACQADTHADEPPTYEDAVYHATIHGGSSSGEGSPSEKPAPDLTV